MNSSDDNSYIAEALPAFISEAHEHIEMLEQLLLQLEHEPDNRELLDALFRSAHTIKGSAGIFGLDAIVAFTHHVETLLDQLRSHRTLTPDISTLLLQCNDEIRTLVDAAQGLETEDEATLQIREALVQQLRAAYGEVQAAVTAAVPTTPAANATQARWQIAVEFGVDTFRNGMDPLAIVNYVRGLGSIDNLQCKTAAIPALDGIRSRELLLAVKFLSCYRCAARANRVCI
ncbi:MAG: Hpt domain-containing protein [Steroidobacteraceae bacterium]